MLGEKLRTHHVDAHQANILENFKMEKTNIREEMSGIPT